MGHFNAQHQPRNLSQFASLETMLANPRGSFNIRRYPPGIVSSDAQPPPHPFTTTSYLLPIYIRILVFYNRDRCVEIAVVAAFATVQRENTQITGRGFSFPFTHP